jgi:hypothetical protein
MTLTQAIAELAELAALAGLNSHCIDFEYWHYSSGRKELTWTVTVHMRETAQMESWSAPTLDEAMTAARAALRPVAVPDAVAAAEAALA